MRMIKWIKTKVSLTKKYKKVKSENKELKKENIILKTNEERLKEENTTLKNNEEKLKEKSRVFKKDEKKLKENYIKLKEENTILKEKNVWIQDENGKLRKIVEESIQVEFFDKNIQNIIIQNIKEAKKELYIAVAWFTSKEIMEELMILKNKGVNIKVMITYDETAKNKEYLKSVCNEFKEVRIRREDNSDYMNKRYKNYMHNKYCIIDDKKVINGSYNWSINAEHNLENIIVITSEKVAKQFKDNFKKIYNDKNMTLIE